MRPLTLLYTLEFYDVPQVIVGTDAMGTHYLCTLFNQSENGYEYIGVQLSEPRLMAFIGGQLDLRDAYLYPEAEGAVWLVTMHRGQLIAVKQLASESVADEMLPEAGYFFDSSDSSDVAAESVDTYRLDVPANDRITFSTIISRMGWHASAMRRTLGKVGVL